MDQESDNGVRVVDNRGKAKEQPQPQSNITDADFEVLKAQAAADDSTPIHDPNRKPVLTAFVVVVDYDGNVQANSDLHLLEHVEMSRPATYSDMYAAAGLIQKDIACQETSVRVMQRIAEEAQRAQEAAMSNQMRQQMQSRR